MATTYLSKAEEQAARKKRILAQAEAQKNFIPRPEHRDESFYIQWGHHHNMDVEDVLKFVKIYDEHLEAVGDWEVALAKANEIWKAQANPDNSSQKEEKEESRQEEKTEAQQPDNSTQTEQQEPKQKTDNNSSQEKEQEPTRGKSTRPAVC